MIDTSDRKVYISEDHLKSISLKRKIAKAFYNIIFNLTCENDFEIISSILIVSL